MLAEDRCKREISRPRSRTLHVNERARYPGHVIVITVAVVMRGIIPFVTAMFGERVP